MTFPVTSLYAAVLALGALVLGNIVSARRGKTNTAILHGENLRLAVWIRRHGNFVETVPLALILMGLAEAQGLSSTWLHTMGAVLTLSRVSHSIGLNAINAKNPLRIAGGLGTQLAMLGAALFLLGKFF